MAKHNLTAEHIARIEADRLAALAAHAAIPVLKAAVVQAQDALSVGEAHLNSLLERIAHAGFQGLDIEDAPPKISAKEPGAPGPKAKAIVAAKAEGAAKIAKKP